MDKYKLLRGTHIQDDITYTAGKKDVIETTYPLDQMFPGKFENLTVTAQKAQEARVMEDRDPLPITVEVAKAEQPAQAEKITIPKKRKTNPLGKDVTDSFEGCSVLDCMVFAAKDPKSKTGKGLLYNVTDLDGETLWNSKPIKSKSKVQAFLKEYLEEE